MVLMLAGPFSCSDGTFSALNGSREHDEKSSEEPAAPIEDSNVDAPVWINGAALTCDWTGISSDSDLSLSCSVKRQNEEISPPAELVVHSSWVITDRDGQTVSFTRKLDREVPFDVLVTMAAAAIPGSTITVWIVFGETVLQYSAHFDETLKGLDNPDLTSCLIAKRVLRECFDEAGIEISTTETAIQGPGASSGWRACPEGFVEVPEDSDGGDAFCVAKYEMKQSASGLVQSVPGGLPLLVNSATTARSSCKALGPDFDLISNAQWIMIARNSYFQPENWSNFVPGETTLSRGHSDNEPSTLLEASSDDLDGCFGSGQQCTSVEIFNTQRRTLFLSSGEVLWDFAGNAPEIIDWAVSPNKAQTIGPTYNEWTELRAASPTSAMPTLSYLPGLIKLDSTAGIGGYYSGQTKLDPSGGTTVISFGGDGNAPAILDGPGSVLRGGGFADGANAGMYSLAIDVDPAHPMGQAGFRCTAKRAEQQGNTTIDRVTSPAVMLKESAPK